VSKGVKSSKMHQKSIRKVSKGLECCVLYRDFIQKGVGMWLKQVAFAYSRCAMCRKDRKLTKVVSGKALNAIAL